MKLQLVTLVTLLCVYTAVSMYVTDIEEEEAAFEDDFDMAKRQGFEQVFDEEDFDMGKGQDEEILINARGSGCATGYEPTSPSQECSSGEECGRDPGKYCGNAGFCCKKSGDPYAVE